MRRLIVATPQEAQAVWKYVRPPEDLDPAAARDRMRSIVDEENRIWKRHSHFIVKYPYLSRHIPLARETFQNAKFVHIVRDGRAVALSLYGRRMRVNPEASDAKGQQLLKNLAGYWVDVLHAIDAERGLIDLVEVRYEDFCTDVRGSLRRILKHVGLDEHVFPYERCPATLSVTNTKWLATAPADAISTLEQIQDPLLLRFGYR